MSCVWILLWKSLKYICSVVVTNILYHCYHCYHCLWFLLKRVHVRTVCVCVYVLEREGGGVEHKKIIFHCFIAKQLWKLLSRWEASPSINHFLNEYSTSDWNYISMAQNKTAVTPLLTLCCLTLSHRYPIALSFYIPQYIPCTRLTRDYVLLSLLAKWFLKFFQLYVYHTIAPVPEFVLCRVVPFKSHWGRCKITPSRRRHL